MRRAGHWVAIALALFLGTLLVYIVSLFVVPWQGPHELRTPVPASTQPR